MSIKTISLLSGLCVAIFIAYLSSYGQVKKKSLDRDMFEKANLYRISDSSLGRFYDTFLRRFIPTRTITMLSSIFGINIDVLDKNIKAAGLEKSISPLEIIVFKLFGIIGGIVICSMGFALKSNGMIALMIIIFGGLVFVSLFLLPQDKINDCIKKRNSDILDALPTFIEQTYMCIEAGANLKQSLESVAQNSEGTLANEFKRAFALSDYSGRWQQELSSMAYNLQIEPLQDFINDIIIAHEKGSGIDLGSVLANEVSHMASINRSRIMGKINALNSSLSIPIMGFCVLPLLGIIMAPQIINFLDMM